MELLYLRCSFLFSVVVYGHWAKVTINGICNFLGIRCLRIPYNPVRSQAINSAVKTSTGNIKPVGVKDA